MQRKAAAKLRSILFVEHDPVQITMSVAGLDVGAFVGSIGDAAVPPTKRHYKKYKVVKSKKGKRATIKCGNCGEPGHQSRTCTKPKKSKSDGTLPPC